MYEPQSRLGGRYELLEAVASNGAYSVWRCRDLSTGVERSVTVVQSGETEPRAALGRVVAELDAIARLADPHLIPALDIVSGEGLIAIVTRALPADDLASLLRNHGPLAPARVAALGAQLCDALASAHAIGLVHGHLAPFAVWLEPGADGRWTVGLSGFGISGLIDIGEAGDVRRAGESVDVLYLAHEVADGEPVSAAADVYAVGVMMHEALTGRRPVVTARGDSRGEPATAEPPPIPVPVPTDQLRRLVSACLARNPRDRPTASYLADRLHAIAASSDVAPAERAGATPGRKRLRSALVGASALALAAGVLTAAMVSIPGPGRPLSGAAAAQVVNPLVPIETGAQPSASSSAVAPTPTVSPTMIGAAPKSAPFGTTPKSTAPTTPVSSSITTSPTGKVGGGPRALIGAQSRKCLDTDYSVFANGTKEQIWTCSGSSGQSWTLAGSALTVDGGAYCLDVYNNQTADGATVDLWYCNGGQNQQWRVNSNGTITGIQSGKCLDVTGAATANGTRVELWTCNGGQNQQWSW